MFLNKKMLELGFARKFLCLMVFLFLSCVMKTVLADLCTSVQTNCGKPPGCSIGTNMSDVTVNGPISSTMLNYYFASNSNRFSTYDPNDLKTSAVYIKCTGDYNDCTAAIPGSYQYTTDINEATLNQSSNNAGACCPLTLCDIPDGVIKGYIDYSDGSVPKDYFTLTPNDTSADITMPNSGLKLRMVVMQGKTCVAALLPAGYYYFACKIFSATSTTPSTNPACAINSACSVKGQNHSLFFLSFTGRMVECVKGAIEVIFNGAQSSCPSSNNFSLLNSLQQNLRPAVMAALILYTIIFGINLALGDHLVQKGQVFGFMIKIILVLYFSVGIKTEEGNYESGINQYVFNGFYSVMSSMSNFVLGSAGGELCNFSQIIKKYDNPYYDVATGKDYSYLAVWDSLDCRLAYYTGLVSIAQIIENNSGKYDWDTFTSALSNSSLLYLFALSIMAFQILFAIMTGIFFSFLLSIAVYFVKLFIMAMVALAVMSYLAVIFVPFALFEQTKPYFESWLSNMISFSLQPVVVTAFMAILMGIFNDIIFNGCQELLDSSGAIITSSCWQEANIKFSIWETNFNTYWWTFNKQNCSTQCQKSFGYVLYNPPSPYVERFDALFFSWNQLSSSAVDTLLPALLKTVLYCFIFYFFAQKISDFAAQITNGIGINAGSPMELFDKVMKAAKEMATTKSAPTGTAKDEAKDQTGLDDKKQRPTGPSGQGGGKGGQSPGAGGGAAGGGTTGGPSGGGGGAG